MVLNTTSGQSQKGFSNDRNNAFEENEENNQGLANKLVLFYPDEEDVLLFHGPDTESLLKIQAMELIYA